MKKLAAFDLVNLAYIGIVSLVVVACRPAHCGIFLAYHAAAAALVALVVYAHGRYGGRFWTLCRYWYVVPFVLGAFREIHYLVPLVHPFDDHHFDRVLASLDGRWFGDVDAFFLRGWPPALMDVLHLCYWFYYVSLVIVGQALYRRDEWPKLREFLSVTMAALLTSYLGYFVVPAIGPHHFLQPRPALLDGWLLGGPMHRAVLAAEWTMPDAFPSGHALMSMVVIAMAWKLHRPAFRIVLVPSLGCILATVALRYHYVVDVAASAAIFPAVLLGGIALHRLREGSVAVTAAPKR
ncbi:MAG: phosphatase PAP2 family protein [Planctomycetaceae bacterium]|nr:phosphatase PAP2 family protein [Planctomycetaceae bacterium]